VNVVRHHGRRQSKHGVAGGWHGRRTNRDEYARRRRQLRSADGDISNKIAIAAGVYHSLAIGTNRTINGWGATNYGQITIPAYATNVLAIAAGGNDSLALVRDPFAPPIPRGLAARRSRAR